MVVKDEEYISPAMAARRLGVTPQRVKQLCLSGKLLHKVTALGRLIDVQSVERLVDERRAKATKR